MDFFHTRISPRAIDLALETLRSTFVSEGKMVRRFEERLAHDLGLVNPLALNSGTSALHLALALTGAGPGDEVILPAQTFVATGLIILMLGAKPVFADIQPRTGNLDPGAVRQKLTARTKAIIPVHWGGYPCDLDEIGALAAERGIAVIEDAAHALGATYKGRPIGSISRFTAFSFQAIKHVTAGDGGALCCPHAADHRRARANRWFGIDRENSVPSLLGEREYDIRETGYKYHMNDLAAAVGLGNLEEFPGYLALLRRHDAAYRARLSGVPGVTLLERRPDRESACWLFTLLVEGREGFVRKLREAGFPASVVHLRIDKNSVFGGITPDLPNQTEFNKKQIALPLHGGVTGEDIESIAEVICQGW